MTARLPLLLILAAFLSGLGTVNAQAEGKVRRNVEIEWEPVEGASLYEVEVVRQDDRRHRPLTFKMRRPQWSAHIKPGLYKMRVRSYDDRHVPGEWSPPSDLRVRLPAIIATAPGPGQHLTSSDPDEQDIDFRWETVPGAEKYKLNVKAANGEWSRDTEVSEAQARVRVPTGTSLLWNVTAVDDKGEDGEVSAQPYAFDLNGPALKTPSIDRPLSKYLREITWTAPPHARLYSYTLKYFDPQTRRWRQVESGADHAGNKLALDISRPTGRYRLTVQAHAEHRQPSTPANLDFDMRGGFRDPAALETEMLRDSLYKPTDFYAIASYLITQVQYSGADYDANSIPSFKALGGTGRVGLGYQNPESDWGGFGIVDLSGFVIDGRDFKFASVEAHLTHKLEFGQKGILLFGTGIYSKELPIVLGSQVDGFSGVGKIRGIGPHAGFTYWFPLTPRLGVQVNARAYYTLFGSASSGGRAQPSLSYQYGLLGSYRLNRAWMGYAGYAYRKDELRYDTDPSNPDSFAHPGQVNEISIDGHYLNLILEFSF